MEVDSSGNLLGCHRSAQDLLQIVSNTMNNEIIPTMDTKVDDLREELCNALGADYDATAKTCSPAASQPSPPRSPSDSTAHPPTFPDFPLAINNQFYPSLPTHSELRDCDRPTYICRAPDSGFRTGMSSQVCGNRPGIISYYGTIEEESTLACYHDPTNHSGQHITVVGYHESSCVSAKAAITDIIDPTNLRSAPSSILPAGHYKARIYCDLNYCQFRNGLFQVKCRLLKRGVSYKCNYSCDPP